MIKLVNVSKHFFLGDDEVKALGDINLEIKDGEYISIVGSSGCGKSTLMYILGLLDQPTSGQVYLGDKDASKLSDEQLSQLRNQHVGFVFQSFNLINKFSVLENVLMPTKYAKTKINFDPEKKAAELLKKFGIWERRNFYPNKISGGQQQRVAIARALMMEPTLILADEPTGNLDSHTGKEILDLLDSLNSEMKVTVVLVTHDPLVAARAKRKIYMQDGKIINQK